MRRLMLLRHAKSDWTDAAAADHTRTLAARGRESAPRIGTYMARHALVPDRVICSTARRARETWDLVTGAFTDAPPVTYDDRLYDAPADRILAVLREATPDSHSLLIIGHNPGLRDLAERVIAAGDVETRQRLLEKFPTAGLAVVDFPIDAWSRLHPRSGRLDRFVMPRALEMSTD
jgi:phosphohistidine phosphatase